MSNNFLRVYGIYKIKGYEDWQVLINSFGGIDLNEWIEGFAFDDDGNFVTAVCLRLPVVATEIGYIYEGEQTHALSLSKV